MTIRDMEQKIRGEIGEDAAKAGGSVVGGMRERIQVETRQRAAMMARNQGRPGN